MVLYETPDGRFFDHELLSNIQNQINNEAQFRINRVDPQHLIDKYGKTLLHYAVTSKNLQIVQYLITRGCDVNAQDSAGSTPLMLAVNAMDTSIVELLLNSNADMFARDGRNYSSLQMVFAHPNAESMYGITKKFLRALRQICSDHEIAKKLIEVQCPLPRTVCYGNIEVVKCMLQQGCFVDSRDQYYQGCTALQAAVAIVNLEAVKLLLEYGADVNVVDNYRSNVFHYYEHDKPETGERLELLRILIDHGAMFNLADEVSAKMATRFLSTCQLKTVRMILKSGINLLSQCKDDNDDIKPLFFTLAINPNKYVINELRGRVSNFNRRDDYSKSALFYAVNAANPDAVEFLLENGADPDLIDRMDRTVLLRAFDLWAKEIILPANNIECVQLLLQYNANAEYRTDYGMTVFDIALRYKQSQLIFMVLQYLAIKEALGHRLDNFILNQISSYRPFFDSFNVYKDTIVRMQSNELYKSITYFQLLTESEQKILSYMANEEIFTKATDFVKYLNGYEEITPYMYLPNVLVKRLERAIEITTLRENAITILAMIEELRNNPYVISKLVLYFDRHDLRNICEIENNASTFSEN